MHNAEPPAPYHAPAAAVRPASTNRTLFVVLAVVTAGALVLCCGGSVAAALFFNHHPVSVVAGRTRTAEPTLAPQPTVAPRPSTPPPPAPLEPDHVLQGRGDKVVPLPAATGLIHVVAITHDGGGGFGVTSLDGAGRVVGLLGNSYGKFRGVLVLDGAEKPTALRVRASGPWRVVVRDARRAPLWTGKGSGKACTVLQVKPDAGSAPAQVHYSHQGTGNFIVSTFGGGSWDLPVNEIGRVAGEATIPAGTRFIEVQANGAWTLART